MGPVITSLSATLLLCLLSACGGGGTSSGATTGSGGTSSGGGTPPVAGPSLQAALPSAAPAGAVVVLKGTRLETASKVSFGGVESTALSEVGSGSLKVVVPVGALSGQLTVTTAAGPLSLGSGAGLTAQGGFTVTQAATGAAPIDESQVKVTYHVSPTGKDSNPGSSDAPFGTLAKALSAAMTQKKANVGVKISIAPGTYREGQAGKTALSFNMALSQSTSALLILEGAGWSAANPQNTGDVIISGSEDFSKGWTKQSDGTWTHAWPYALGVPTKSVSFGVCDAFLRYEAAFVDGQTWYQINPPNYNNVNSDADGKFGGFAEGDSSSAGNPNGGRLTANEGAFWVQDAVLNSDGSVATLGTITLKPSANAGAGYDLNAHQVEVATKRTLIQFWLGEGSTNKLSPTPTNVILRNLTFQHAGSYAALIQSQNNLLMEDCRVRKSKHSGLTLTSGQNITLRRVECTEMGESGAGANNVSNSLMDRCSFSRNSRQGEILGFTGWSVCGIKPMRCVVTTMLRCVAQDNRSTGFWWDTGNVQCEMIECVSTGNSTNGTFIEDNNGTANNYENPGTGSTGVEGIDNLGTRPTVTALRTLFAHNRPAAGTESYQTGKGRGVFSSENENYLIQASLLYDNDVQIAVYDNNRGEMRNNQVQGCLVAAAGTGQRLYAVGSSWESGETISVKNSAGAVIATLKGGWYGFFDGLTATTNDNTYFSASANAFPARAQRWGTIRWTNAASPYFNNLPTLSLEAWRSAHTGNPNNGASDKAVDSRSRLNVGNYDGSPLVAATARVARLPKGEGAQAAFVISRVAPGGYDQALTVAYSLSGSATSGADFEPLSGTVTIPAQAREVTVAVTPKAGISAEKTLVLSLTAQAGLVVGGREATCTLLP